MPENTFEPSPADPELADASVVSPPRQRGSDPESAIKALAKALARDASARIPDRHVRAEVRAHCYNQMIAVLRQLEGRQATQRARQRRLETVLGATIAVLAAALAASVLA